MNYSVQSLLFVMCDWLCPPIDVPTPLDLTDMEDEVAAAMLKAGFEPQIIYAYKKTGLIGIAGAIDNWPTDRR